MKIADLPDNEKERLSALHNYDVLDTDPEESFDELTRLAADICGTSIALVSLVDEHRQWFKAKVGTEATETSRETAFCAHAIHHDDITEILDARLDERFSDNPLVSGEPYIRFYAGAPLVSPKGFALGTLCVIDSHPRSLSSSQRKVLKSLSAAVVSQLELRQRNRELKQINQFRSNFISYISHELRTPLNAVVTFADLLEDEIKALGKSDKDAPLLTKLGYIRYSGERILSTVNSVLELNKLEAGKMQVFNDTVDTKAMLTRLAGIARVQADKKNLQFTFDIPKSLPNVIEIDESKFAQIALNLISNAIKYTEEGKEVTISVLVDPATITLFVKDHGCGISEAEQQNLFKHYERLESSRGTEGTGLGLVITKGLVELMGGNIYVSSELGKGTLVKVQLPVEESSEPANDSPMRSQTSKLRVRDGARILVVEDNSINQVVVDSVFSRLGLAIEFADTGEECLNMMADNTFDIVFMDIRLPGISGLETAKIIHQQQPDLPVVALTADVVVDEETYKKSGILNVLTKPISQRALVAILNHYLG